MRYMKNPPPTSSPEVPVASSSSSPSSDTPRAITVRFLTIDAELAGQRLDNFLMAQLKGVPKSRIYNLVRKGEVRVNKGRSRPDYKLCAGDLVRVPPVRTAEARVAAPAKAGNQLVALLDQSVLFENEGLLVINKPPGLAVHGGSGVNLGLIETLRQMRPEARYLELVHRLDRDTSGCIMVAKKRSYLRHLQAALRDKVEGQIEKVYCALVVGHWPARLHQVNAPLLRTEVGADERYVRVHPDGKPSLTLFNVIQRYQGFTLVEARPVTGRTHQIRVHARHAGHGLVGDEKYGDDDINLHMRNQGIKRLFLHASSLGFCLPGEAQMTWVEAPLPQDLAQPLSCLESLGD